MSARQHPDGICTCATHVDRPWNRPEHWTAAEVGALESHFGLIADEALARRLGRTVTGLRLKAKRIGLHKRTQAFTAREVARLFGVDSTMVVKVWIRRGLLSARAGVRQERTRRHPSGRPSYWIVDPAEVERFIRQRPEYVDVDKMPDSPYRELAARDPWIGLAEVHRRTGRSHHAVAQLIGEGRLRGRKRGAHWYMPVTDLPLIRPLRSVEAIEDSVFRRQSVLEIRRNRRKGVAIPPADRRPSLLAIQRVAS